jgi:hypothetical protein
MKLVKELGYKSIVELDDNMSAREFMAWTALNQVENEEREIAREKAEG